MSSQELVDFIHEQLKSVSELLAFSYSLNYSFVPVLICDIGIYNFQETKLSTVCEKVVDRCLAPDTASGEGCDNMTIILIQFKKPNPSENETEELEPSQDEPSSSS